MHKGLRCPKCGNTDAFLHIEQQTAIRTVRGFDADGVLIIEGYAEFHDSEHTIEDQHILCAARVRGPMPADWLGREQTVWPTKECGHRLEMPPTDVDIEFV
jgi:hypothetical protein